MIPLRFKGLNESHINTLPSGIVHIGVLGESGLDINPAWVSNCSYICGASCKPMRVKVTFGDAKTDSCEPCAPQSASVKFSLRRTDYYGDFNMQSQNKVFRERFFHADLSGYSTTAAPAAVIATQFLDWVASGNLNDINETSKFVFTATAHPSDPKSVYVFLRTEDGFAVPCEQFDLYTYDMVGASVTVVDPGFLPSTTNEELMASFLERDVQFIPEIDFTVNDGEIDRCKEYCWFEFTVCIPAGCGPGHIPNAGNILGGTGGASMRYYSLVEKGKTNAFINKLQTALLLTCANNTEVAAVGNNFRINIDHSSQTYVPLTEIMYNGVIYTISPVRVNGVSTSVYVQNVQALQDQLIALTGNQDITVEGYQVGESVTINIPGVTSLVVFFAGNTATLPQTVSNATGTACPVVSASKPAGLGAVATITGAGNVPANVKVEVELTDLTTVPTMTLAANGANLNVTFSAPYDSATNYVTLRITNLQTGCFYFKTV